MYWSEIRLAGKIGYKSLITNPIPKVEKIDLQKLYYMYFYPIFETQSMVSRIYRKINSKTVRSMLTWSHYRFRMHLMSKAQEYSNCYISIYSEQYTSKACDKMWISS